MSEFIIIRSANLNLFPEDLTRNTRMCAAALLEYFKNQFKGQRKNWFTITIAELRERLLEQFGKDAIAKACCLLDELGLVVRRHHRLNPRAWQYKYLGQNSATVSETSATVTETSATVTETSANILIYKDPTPKIQTLDPPQGGAEEKTEEKETSAKQTEEIEEVSQERKNEISAYIGEFASKDQSSEPDFLGEKIPANLQQKLEKAGIEVDEKVREAIASHHISQAHGAAQHCIDTAETIKNPKGVFLFQISRQPIESVGPRLAVKTAADFEVESAPCSPEIREEAYKIIAKIREEVNQEKTRRLSRFI